MHKNIVFLGDLHIGNLDDAHHVLEWLHFHLDSNTDDLILMGDMIDTGIDRGMGWEQASTNKQLLYLRKVLEPYNVLGYIRGNHEYRMTVKTGLNPYQAIFGNETDEYEINGHRINIAHGKSGAQNQALELARLSEVHPKADVVALGHTHSLGIYVLPHGVIGLRTGHLQRYTDYAKRAVMIPKPLGCIRFFPDTFKFELVM